MCWNLNANDPDSARRVRKAATAALRVHTSSEETLGAAELVIGELLSNAARHGGGEVCLQLGLDGGNAQVSVHDTCENFSLDIKRPPDEYSESGRGLFIISELTLRIDVTPLGGMGKRITVTLDLPVGSPAAFEPTCIRRWLHRGEGVCTRPRIERDGAEAKR